MTTKARSSLSVSAALRKNGVTTGVVYTQTGYMRHGQRFVGQGTLITRNRRARYGGNEDVGGVAIYLLDTDTQGNTTVLVPAEFTAQVRQALENAGLRYTANKAGDYFLVLDDEEN